ncbi:MAG: DUF2683 family protein [Nanoarchaeota archaeon]|nr:DUF2683 family protein [Nanoarchaeota archaeon]
MVKTTVDIPEEENRILNVVKGKYGFRNKEEALIFILRGFMDKLEPEIRPEYIEKLEQIRRDEGIPFKNIGELRKIIES